MTKLANQFSGDIKVDPEVPEGGTLTVHVSGGAKFVTVTPAGGKSRRVRVVNGRAEYPLPPSVTAGTRILITDDKIPPSSGGVTVVGSD